jgi:hypothetical protein
MLREGIVKTKGFLAIRPSGVGNNTAVCLCMRAGVPGLETEITQGKVCA